MAAVGGADGREGDAAGGAFGGEAGVAVGAELPLGPDVGSAPRALALEDAVREVDAVEVSSIECYGHDALLWTHDRASCSR